MHYQSNFRLFRTISLLQAYTLFPVTVHWRKSCGQYHHRGAQCHYGELEHIAFIYQDTTWFQVQISRIHICHFLASSLLYHLFWWPIVLLGKYSTGCFLTGSALKVCLLCLNDYSMIFQKLTMLKLLMEGTHVGYPFGGAPPGPLRPPRGPCVLQSSRKNAKIPIK